MTNSISGFIEDLPKNIGDITIEFNEPTEIKVQAQLDDESFKVGDFIQELGKIQEKYFNELLQKVEENNWVEGLGEEELRDWLFDYCFNGWDNDDGGFDLTFSETLAECALYKLK
jgi:hypothetical protein